VPLIFPFSVDDPLAAEHALVSRWVREAVASLPVGRYYEDVDLKDSPSGRDLLANSPERSRLLVQAALVQARFWHTTTETLRERGVRDGQGTNLTQVVGWPEARGGENKTIAVIAALLRRSLPLDRTDLLQLRTAYLSVTLRSLSNATQRPTRSMQNLERRHGASRPRCARTTATMPNALLRQWTNCALRSRSKKARTS
jgi:hypothetical protein